MLKTMIYVCFKYFMELDFIPINILFQSRVENKVRNRKINRLLVNLKTLLYYKVKIKLDQSNLILNGNDEDTL